MERVVKEPRARAWHIVVSAPGRDWYTTACGVDLALGSVEVMELSGAQSAGAYCRRCLVASSAIARRRGWRQRLARALADALAWLSKGAGQ